MSEMDVDDALTAIIERLRADPDGYGEHGYGVYLPRVWRAYIADRDGIPRDALHRLTGSDPKISPPFYAAAWELCRRGYLRPSIIRANEITDKDGPAGNGYSLTPLGRRWLEEIGDLQFIPTEPMHIARLLEPFADRFGPGYHQRAQEAVKCYIVQAHMACCAMCGAAAESILLSAAIAKSGDEEAVLKEYQTASGRGRVEKRLLGNVKADTRRRFETFTDLLNYWRDTSSHGRTVARSEVEAFDALSRLLRFSLFVDERWDELTETPDAASMVDIA